MAINHQQFKREVNTLNRKILKQTYYQFDLSNSNTKIKAFINDDTRKRLLSLKDKLETFPELATVLKKELTRDVLYIGSECERLAFIDIEKEYKSIKKILTNEYVQLIRVEPPTIATLLDRWDKTKPEIVFFSCHGDTYSLFLNDDEGKCVQFLNTDLIAFLEARSNYTECVILSACESLTIAKLISGAGKNVIAVNKKVDIKTATKFNKYFLQYINNHSLSYSHVYREAFNYSQEIVRYKGLEDSFAFEFISGNKIG